MSPTRFAPASVRNDVVRVATWNVLYRDRQSRLAEVVRIVTEVDPLILLLQETNSSHAVEVGRALGLDVAVIPEHDPGDPSQHVPALLTSLPVERTSIIELPSQSRHRQQYAVAAVLATAYGPVQVCTTHLAATRAAGRMALGESRPDADIAANVSERLAQIAHLRDALCFGSGGPLILGGDLNFVPNGQEYQQVLGMGLMDAWLAGPRIGSGVTVLEDNPLVAESVGVYADRARSLYPGISGPLDYTLDYQFHTPGLAVVGAWTFGRPTAGSQWASDHLGIAADYRGDQ